MNDENKATVSPSRPLIGSTAEDEETAKRECAKCKHVHFRTDFCGAVESIPRGSYRLVICGCNVFVAK